MITRIPSGQGGSAGPEVVVGRGKDSCKGFEKSNTKGASCWHSTYDGLALPDVNVVNWDSGPKKKKDRDSQHYFEHHAECHERDRPMSPARQTHATCSVSRMRILFIHSWTAWAKPGAHRDSLVLISNMDSGVSRWC